MIARYERTDTMKRTKRFATVFLAVVGVAFSQDWDRQQGQLDAQRKDAERAKAGYNKSAQLARGDYDTCVATHQLTGPPVPTPYMACVRYLIIAAYYKGMAAAVDDSGHVPADKSAQLMTQETAALQKASYLEDAAIARNHYLSCKSSVDGLANPSTCERYQKEAEMYDKLANDIHADIPAAPAK